MKVKSNTNFKSLSKRLLLGALVMVNFLTFQSVSAATSVWDGSLVRPSLGSGTEEDPFLITTAEEMAYLIRTYDYNEGINYKKFYKLTSDLDMKSTQWTFGSASSDRKSFRAHFNGDGHIISNIEITLNDAPGECHMGLFPQLGGDEDFESVIENLEVANIHFVRSTGDATGTYNYRIGGLVGKMYSNSRISNCIVRGFSVTDYGMVVDLKASSRISACPLVGEVLDYFGSEELSNDNYKVVVSDCYGFGHADLSHFHGNNSQIYSTNTQGKLEDNGFVCNGYARYLLNEEECSFARAVISISPVVGGGKFQYEGDFVRQKGHTYTYLWTLDGERIGTNKSATITVDPKPQTQRLGLTVYGNGQLLGSSAMLIEPEQYYACITETKKDVSYLSGKVVTESGIVMDEEEFDFEWQDMSKNNTVVATGHFFPDAQEGHTYLLVATHKKNKAAKFSAVKSFSRPIFVCNRGISSVEAAKYTDDGQTYKRGSDSNDGLTPETAVRTLRRAYDLMASESMGGSIDQNVIVIMGEYSDYDFSEFVDSKCTKYNDDYFVKDRPALITGRYDNFRNSRLLFAGMSIKIAAPTRFEALNLQGSSFEIPNLPDQTQVFACGNDLTLGYGIFVSGYNMMDYSHGLDEGVLAPALSIFGGVLNNDNPFYESKPNTVTILSGTYGRVIAGDGYTVQMDRTGNVSGSPEHPVRAHLVFDCSNYYNPYHTQYDIALVVGGQSDGAIFADTRIDVKGNSNIGRIVAGNVGYGRHVKGRPADSFFGHTEVNILDGEVTEVFGANLARYGSLMNSATIEHDSCVTYFYGKSVLNFLGGTVYGTVYGGGAACVIGSSYDKKHYTADPYVPYMRAGRVAFGRYEEAEDKMPVILLGDSSRYDLSKTELHVNIGGTAHLMGSLYGGSVSFSSLLPTHQAGSQTGCVFGDTYVHMDGGLIDGYIFGGCRGNLSYFDDSDHSGYPIINGVQMDKLYFSNMALMYGNGHIEVTGGEVKGVIFGAGEGTYYRPTSYSDITNAVGMMGSTFGSTNVTIGGEAVVRDYICGAGNYAHVLRTGDELNPEQSGMVEININGGNLYAAVFGGGHGNRDIHNDAFSIYPRVAGDVHINLRGGRFCYNPKRPRYIDQRIYGVICGGLATSFILGNTYLTVEANPFTEELRTAKSVNANEDFVICAGGYGPDCYVSGKSHLLLNSSDAPKIDCIYMGGIYGTVESTEARILSGSVENLYGIGRYGAVTSNNVNIIIGEEDGVNNSMINVDNLFTGKVRSKSKVKIFGGNVMNVLGGDNNH